jgi:predicted nucleic acid-binding protein
MIFSSIQRRVVTSNYILAELSALLISPIRLAREIRLAALDRIRAQHWFKITHIDSEADAGSWRYMQSRRDKDYGVVDCSSFVLML